MKKKGSLRGVTIIGGFFVPEMGEANVETNKNRLSAACINAVDEGVLQLENNKSIRDSCKRNVTRSLNISPQGRVRSLPP